MSDKGFPIQSFTAVLDSAYDGTVMDGMQWRLGPDGQAFAYPGSGGGGGGGGTAPTGTGFVHITSGAQDGAAKLVQNADVATNAAILESKLALNYATHSNANDPTAGQKAALAGSSGTPGASNVYVTNADSRLSDARTPTSHTHPLSQITQSSAASGDVPKWNGSAWVPSATAAPSAHTHPLSDLTQSGATSGQVATWDGAGWVPADAPSASLPALIGAKTLTGSAYTLVSGTPGGKTAFTSGEFDTSGFFSVAGEFTIPAGQSGYYLMQAEALVYSAGDLDGERAMQIRDANATTTIYAIARYNYSTNEIGFNISGVGYLAAGDTIEIVLSQGTGSDLTVELGRFSLIKLGI